MMASSQDRKSPRPDMACEDIRTIRRHALTNIATEIMQVSNLVEKNIGDLSDEFIKLVKYSRQQVEDITTACNLLPHDDIARKILTQAVAVSSSFDTNVNKMIYSLQFQDRTRQLMQAMAITLDILIALPERPKHNNGPGKPQEELIISQQSRTILNHLIKTTAHKELDQNYIVKMFAGAAQDETGTNETPDSTDIEFF